MTRDADFIKPMLYRRTEAPAGIGYEYALFERYAPKAEGRAKPCMDRAFLHTQLAALRNLPCRAIPGIEINYDADSVKTDPEYIRESLEEIRSSGFGEAALCWDVTQAPETNLEAVFRQDLYHKPQQPG